MEELNKENGLEGFEALFKERQKKGEAEFAILLWEIYGVVVLIAGKIKGLAPLILYFFVGIFVASLTAGIINYLIQQLLVRVLMKIKASDSLAYTLSIPLTILKIAMVVIAASIYLSIIQ